MKTAVIALCVIPFLVACSGLSDQAKAEPSPAIQAWMDRLTVDHEYDPETGFIVARETVGLPAIISESPRLDNAIEDARDDQVVIAFATADRCAPCQQYKRDALNNPDVLATLSGDHFVATHVEVDRQPGIADNFLGGRAIPMTYALRGGEVVAMLRGQRSATELMAWLESVR